VSIPVIANGDIDSPGKAKWVLEHTKADGIMIGRAAVGNPWIFHQIKTGEEQVNTSLMREVVLEHFDQMIDHYGDYGAIMFRKHLHTYSKAGFQGASAFRNEVNTVSNASQMRDIVYRFFSQEVFKKI
ncbi:tRNA-dihydrouridine synthase, partial [Sulfurovum sp.]